MAELLNAKAIEHLATITGIQATELSAALLTTEADVTKHDPTKIKTIIPDGAVLGLSDFKSKADYDTWKKNYQKEQYDKGKEAGVEMLVKDAKKTFGVGVDGDGNKDFSWLMSEYKKKVITEAGIAPDKKVVDLESDKLALQGQVISWENKYNTLTQQLEQVKASSQTMLIIQTEVNKLDIDVDPTLLIAQRNMVAEGFQNKYTIVKDGTADVVKDKATGDTVKDSLLKPKSPADVIHEFAASVVKLKAKSDEGRNASSSNRTGATGSDADLAKISNAKELIAYYTTNGINPHGEEARNIQAKVMKLNPNFGKTA